MEVRKQITLFLDHEEACAIEKARQFWNPDQYALIKAHITLVRDDRVDNFAEVTRKVKQLKYARFQVNFGAIERFCEGKGAFIPVTDRLNHLVLLREKLSVKDQKYDPHITIMHPRNSMCTDEIFNALLQETFPSQITISSISLIEQINGGKWRTTDHIRFK